MGRINAAAIVERQILKTNKTALVRSGLYSILGLICVKASLLGVLSPFGVALAASLPGRDALPAILGAAAGYLLFAPPTFLKYISALILLLAFGWEEFTGVLAKTAKRLHRPALTAIVLGAPGLALTVLTGGNVYDGLLVLCESAMAAAAVFFFARTRTVLPMGVENYRQADVIAVLASSCIFILALMPVGFFGFSLGRLLAVCMVLAGAFSMGESGGAITGVAAGLTTGILGGEGYLMSGFALGGLLSGVFSTIGKVAAIVAFAVVNLFLLLSEDIQGIPLRLGEILSAGAILLALPQSMLSPWSLRRQQEALSVQSRQDMLSGRLSEMSAALRDVAHTTRRINEMLNQNKQDPAEIFHLSASQVCKSCSKNNCCWQQRYSDTMNVLNDALHLLRLKGSLFAADLPEYFREMCLSPDKLATSIHRNFNAYIRNQDITRRLANAREVLTDQFEGMALLMDGLEEEISELLLQDSATQGKVRRYLEKQGAAPDYVRCAVNGDGLARLSFRVPRGALARLPPTTLTLAISELCLRDFILPYVREKEETETYTFTEKTAFTVQWSVSQQNGANSRHCGDSYGYVDAQWGRLYFILSDGMGSGAAAAVDSAMTVDLLSRLLEAGISMEGALRLVNCALLSKTGRETLATLDVTEVNLYTGRIAFYKAGAAPTFLLRTGRGGYVESRSLPVGVMTGVSFEKSALMLRHNDWVVMVSDGVTTSGCQWVVKTMEDNAALDTKTLCELILKEAHHRRTDGHQDDITVLAFRLLECA